MADGFMPKSLDMHVMPLSRHQSRSVRLYCVYVYDLSPNSIQRLIFIQREVWNSAKKLLGIIQQKVHKVMPDGTIRTRTLENLPNSVATGSTTTIFYPNWKGPCQQGISSCCYTGCQSIRGEYVGCMVSVITQLIDVQVIRPAQVDDNEIRILVQSYWKHLRSKYSRDEAEREHKRVKMAHYMSNKRRTAQVV